ncbi:dihydropteroate synthase [Micromonospora sp. WMMD1102]|uniref:dihydropteroate synthase n=1 Tax=Micromonospora sp. WMMD1102 TaxID=3016105 RepID=UPI0024157D8E|nr:dihydropteroate synthase [Micromonospora sp. WMMD1102]MDG4787993.1 dihydropteroate synthase [Micromonospora sp. WMMD1102]
MLDPTAVRDLLAGGSLPPAPRLELPGRRTFELARRRRLVAVVNLSADSPYPESVAESPSAARRLAVTARDAGADFVEFGLESTAPGARTRDAGAQLDLLLPALEQCLDLGVEIMVETRHPAVVETAMRLGVRMVNLVGYAHRELAFDTVARYDGAVVLPYLPGGTPALGKYTLRAGDTAVPDRLDFLRSRLGEAEAAGVTRCVVDPAIGFAFELDDGTGRASYQMSQYLQLHRLGALGVPVLATLVHAPGVFAGAYRRLAEPIMAVLAMIGGGQLLRTHEVGAVETVRRLLDSFEP